MAADTYSDHPGRLSEPGEYWHIHPDGDGMAGPFTSVEEAKQDALQYLHSSRYRITEVRIVKTVTVSATKVSFDTEWKDA